MLTLTLLIVMPRLRKRELLFYMLLVHLYVYLACVTFCLFLPAGPARSDASSDWYSGGRGFDPRVRHNLS